jgi:cbb3-type cytochrome oxidase maturation protein
MTAIYLMLPVSLLLALIFLIAYVWSVRTGQYEDTRTPALRILTEDAGGRQAGPASKTNRANQHS